MKVLILVTVVLAIVYTEAMSTTKEPNESERLKFAYDNKTHKMIVLNHHNCYIFTLTQDEMQSVHTDAGIRALEKKLLGLIDSGTHTQTTKDTLEQSLQHLCSNKATTFYNSVA